MTKEYKDTLNLPKTDFPMKANLAQREPQMQKRWNEGGLYQKIRDTQKGKPKFILHDGPPYANGRPHMGTAFNKTLKDVIVKSKTLSGYDAPFVPGWDCHGLPIELNVEKKVGKAGDKISNKEFRKACRVYAEKQLDLQLTDFQRLGVFADWQHPYLTMDYAFEANTVRALAKIINNGHLQRGEKPVHWCTACASALAEAEVEYKDKSSPAVDVAFSVVDSNAIYKVFNVDADAEVLVPIWTTTPWTLPANEAVCLHPDVHYALVECEINNKQTHLVLAEDLIGSVMQRYGIDHYEVKANVTGSVLEKIKLQHPFLDRQVPIILGHHVTTETGTGNVHTAPAHGLEDYVVGQQYGLPVNNPVDSRSCFGDDMPLVANMHVFKANEPIVVALADSGKLLHHETLQHSYPHCWRHKTPLIFRATTQWFISMTKADLGKKAAEQIDKVKWIPAWGANRIRSMVEDRPDWCISRQRAWGIPIAIFAHKKTGELHPNTEALMEKAAQLIEQGGVDAWHDADANELIGNDVDDYDKVTDILDVWFDSGSSHFCVLKQRPQLQEPADVYFEGSDQHRGWFQSSLLTGTAINDHAPYKTVLTHGYVVDSKGHKMSKSLGNTILPADVVKNLGADVLRLWAVSCDYMNDVSVSDEILKRSSEAYRRMRNTARFLLGNISDFDPAKDKVDIKDMVALDRWAVIHAMETQKKIIDALDQYKFQHAYQLIYQFCNIAMGSFYLDVIKDRQYTAKKEGRARRSAQTAMFYIMEALVRWLAPILSFTADEIWPFIPGEREDSVFLTSWFTGFPKIDNADAELTYWESIRKVRDEVNRVLESHRNDKKIGSGLDAKVSLYAEDALYKDLIKLEDELRFALITSDACVMPIGEANGDATATEMSGLSVKVDVSAAEKCARCWQRREDVGSDNHHPTLCGRCVVNIETDGEQRRFA